MPVPVNTATPRSEGQVLQNGWITINRAGTWSNSTGADAIIQYRGSVSTTLTNNTVDKQTLTVAPGTSIVFDLPINGKVGSLLSITLEARNASGWSAPRAVLVDFHLPDIYTPAVQAGSSPHIEKFVRMEFLGATHPAKLLIGDTIRPDIALIKNNPTALTYNWMASTLGSPWNSIGVVTPTYTITAADFGKSLFCVIKATNAAGYGIITCYAAGNTSEVVSNIPLTPPVITGRVEIGATLTVGGDTWVPTPTKRTYQWYRNGVLIPSASGATYVPIAADEGKLLTCAVTAYDSGNRSNSAISNEVGPITQPAPAEGTVLGSSCSGMTLVQEIADGNWGSNTVTTAKSPACGYAPPGNTMPPTISGITRVPQVLTANEGTWTGTPTFTYKWYMDGVVIVGQTNKTLTLMPVQVGKFITVEVIATNSSDSIGVKSAAVGPVQEAYPATGTILGTRCEEDTLIKKIADGNGGFTEQSFPVSKECTPPEPPKNISRPFFTGELRQGNTVVANIGEWTGAFLTYTAKFIIGGVEVLATLDGKTVQLTITADMVGKPIIFSVTGTNAWGSATATSVPQPNVLPPHPTTGTVIGTMCQGFDKYNRVANGSGGETHTLVEANSRECGYIGPPVNVVLPSIDGVIKVDSIITANKGAWENITSGVVYTYQWYADGVAISGETNITLLLTASQAFKKITVEVKASTIHGSATAMSLPSVSVDPNYPPAGKLLSRRCEGKTEILTLADGEGGSYETLTEKSPACGFAPPVNMSIPRITGESISGNTLHAHVGTWSGFQPITYTYVWYADDVPIPDATSSSYVIDDAYVGKRLSVKVTATNEDGTGEAKSADTRPVKKGFPPKGKKLGERCEGQVLLGIYANGTGGTYEVVLEADSLQCNWVYPQSVGTVLSTSCIGTTKVEAIANGQRGSYNIYYTKSTDCGYTDEPTNPVDIKIEQYRSSDNYTLRFLAETLGWYRDRMGFSRPILTSSIVGMQENLWAATRAAVFETQAFDECIDFILDVFRENRDNAFSLIMLMRTVDMQNSQIYGDQRDAYKGIMELYTTAVQLPSVKEVSGRLNVSKCISEVIFSYEGRGRLIKYFI